MFKQLFLCVEAVSELNGAVENKFFRRAVFVHAEISVSHKLKSVTGFSIRKALFTVSGYGFE